MAEVAGDIELVKGLEGSGLFVFINNLTGGLLGEFMGLDEAKERIKINEARVDKARENMRENLESYNVPLEGWTQTGVAMDHFFGDESPEQGSSNEVIGPAAEDETLMGDFGNLLHSAGDGLITQGIAGTAAFLVGGLADLTDATAETFGLDLWEDGLRDKWANSTVSTIRDYTGGAPDLSGAWSRNINHISQFLVPGAGVLGAGVKGYRFLRGSMSAAPSSPGYGM